MAKKKYSREKLSKILAASIPKFRKLLKDDKDAEFHLPLPQNFAYLHEFVQYYSEKSCIIVVGLNP